MASIFLVRHGQDIDNEKGILNGHRDTDLTSLGKDQALRVAKKLRDKDIEVILSSPLKRTRQTAEIIAREFNLEVVPEGLLVERDFGILTGKPVSRIKDLAKEVLDTDQVSYFLEVEGAEDFPALIKRANRLLVKIREKYGLDKNILLVTHGDIGKMIRATYNNWTWEEGLKTPHFDNTDVIELKNENN